MGFLSEGEPLDWPEVKKHTNYIIFRGIDQFIKLYQAHKSRVDKSFKFGDEIEYQSVKLDHANKLAKLNLNAVDVFKKVSDFQKSSGKSLDSVWNEEFTAYILEGVPANPYGLEGSLAEALCSVEPNMLQRRLDICKFVNQAQGETVMSLTNFPRFGCPGSCHPTHPLNPSGSVCKSMFLPDETVFPGNPFFLSSAKNFIERGGSLPFCNVPIYRDDKTPKPFVDTQVSNEKKAKPDHIFMDSVVFGAGCCALQVTQQATDVAECKWLYDQLVPMTPIMTALSAATPIFRGLLSDHDCRWQVISDTADDRTAEEKRLGVRTRFSSVALYLSHEAQQYNDLQVQYNETMYKFMLANDIEPGLAKHITHLREPICMNMKMLSLGADQLTDHFDNMQSCNWQTLRFKPPPAFESPSIGWRVEFRPIEVQPNDYANAAFTVFVILLSRAILAYKLNLLMPISVVDKELDEAQQRDALRNKKFWFRTKLVPSKTSTSTLDDVLRNNQANDSSSDVSNFQTYAAQLSANDIVNGNKQFVGLMPIVLHYVNSTLAKKDGSNAKQIAKIKEYLELISDRASGKRKTAAQYIRDWVRAHPDYKKDSVVSDKINYDLVVLLDKIGKQEVNCSELGGNVK